MIIREAALAGGLQGTLLTPERTTGLGVVVLGGSSDKVDVARARLFAVKGAIALALRWFGGDCQPPAIYEMPLETFTGATDRLLEAGYPTQSLTSGRPGEPKQHCWWRSTIPVSTRSLRSARHQSSGQAIPGRRGHHGPAMVLLCLSSTTM